VTWLQEDLATLTRLQEEFAAELATLRGRVDALEASAAELEAQQFSTTTKLTGKSLLAGIVTGENADGDERRLDCTRGSGTPGIEYQLHR